MSAEPALLERVELGFPGRDLHAEAFTQKDNIIRMGVPPFRIEILTGVSLGRWVRSSLLDCPQDCDEVG